MTNTYGLRRKTNAEITPFNNLEKIGTAVFVLGMTAVSFFGIRGDLTGNDTPTPTPTTAVINE
jgi:hypothetical protein